MDKIRQAIERAKIDSGRSERSSITPAQRIEFDPSPRAESSAPARIFDLNSSFLQSNRVVTHVVGDPYSRPFDMLRTQVLHSLDAKGASILGVTSPTPGCGKTVTAANLAFSIARQSERSVLLVDFDFFIPKVASTLGIESDDGVLGVLEGRTQLSSSVLHAQVGAQRLKVLPTKAAKGSAELMASRAMATLFKDLKRDYPSHIVIVDLPPILASDDVITILPQIGCVLVVLAIGTSKVSDINECFRHLQSVDVVRVVLNKVPDAADPYYY